MFLRLYVAALVAMGLAVNCALGSAPAAAFKPPVDGKFTEAQLVQFLDTQKEWLDVNSKILEAMTTAKSPAEKAKAAGGIDQQYKACLDRHQLSREEYDWIGRQARQAWGAAAYLDGSYKSSRDQLDAELKALDVKLAADREQLATYQEALKDGSRVLSPTDRDAIVKQARTEEQTARDDAKRREDEMQQVDSEAKQHDADAQRAEDAAANPPADLSGDERADYIQNKKDEAAASKASAKEARNQEADSKSAEAEALGKADAAVKREEHPEIPTSEDAKEMAKADDKGAIVDLNLSIKQLTAERADLVKNQKGLDDTAKKITAGVPDENVTIMRKYADRYKDQIGEALAGSATTRKSG
jgi:hypothetical protein